jgi:hypothetical protein
MAIPINASSATRARTAAAVCGLGMLASIAVALASCGGRSTFGQQPRQLIALAVQPSAAGAYLPSGAAPFSATGTFDQAPTAKQI